MRMGASVIEGAVNGLGIKKDNGRKVVGGDMNCEDTMVDRYSMVDDR